MKLITLTQASKQKYYRVPVNIQVHITGKAILPYQIPKEISIICKPKKTCKECTVQKEYINKGKCVIELTKENPDLIRFVNVNDYMFPSALRKMLHINPRCQFKYEINSVYTVEEIYMTEIDTENNSNISRIGYSINVSMDTNTPYMITCYSYPEPKTQKIIHIITDAEKLKTDIEDFELNKKNIKKLEAFNPLKKNNFKDDDGDDEEDPGEKVREIYSFLEDLYDIYADNITRIYKRFDLHMAIDLVFHSPLQFKFNNEIIYKGWLDVMIIGDTRCGKGYVSENLIKYYGFGEIVSGENASFAGLVGGVQQSMGRWVATWGKIPLNNKRLVVIDESGELNAKDFSRLSRIRSEGIAEIAKIHTERTQAMTRLIFLTNPRNRMISSYSFGIESLMDLIENSEDISRFDYVVVVSQNEVDSSEINKARKKSKNEYEDIDSLLIQWIWSRDINQVKFEKEAEKLVLQYATKLGKMYSPKIPLIQGENIRIKLAKIAAAIAGRLFSHDKDNLIIKSEHVKAAFVFLNIIYKKPSSGYYTLSQMQKETQEIYNLKGFESYMGSFENKYDLIHYFMSNNYITVTDISECINQPKEIAREIVSKLIHHRCISKKYTFYVKNKCFTDWLRKY